MNERKIKLNKYNFKYDLIDNILSYFKYQILSEIEENNNNLPIFNSVLYLINNMNNHDYSYTLKDIDDRLFDKLIKEIISIL